MTGPREEPMSAGDAPPRRNGHDHAPAEAPAAGPADVPAGRFALARARFPGAAEQVYMDVAGRGLISRDSRDAVDRYLDMRVHVGADKVAMFAQVERVRARFAGLIGAAPDEVAFTGNTSEGINLIAASLPWREGDSVVLCADLEHPNNVFPWLNLARRTGLVVRRIPATADGRIDAAAMADAVDASTRVVTVSTVSFAPGLRTDMAPIAAACRGHGALLLVDAAQSAGILHTDVDALGADAIAVSTQKGLLGLYGMGFLYCRRRVAEAINPVFLARFGVDLGEGAHEAGTGGDDTALRYMAAARRFDVGHPNFLASAALEPALELIAGIGTEAIEAHVTALAARMAEGFRALGLPVAGGASGNDLGHIVSVGRLGQGQHDTAEDPVINALYGRLREHGVRLSIRRGMLRFSLHLYNDEGDVDRVLTLTRRHLGGDGAEGRA